MQARPFVDDIKQRVTRRDVKTPQPGEQAGPGQPGQMFLLAEVDNVQRTTGRQEAKCVVDGLFPRWNH